MGTWIEIAISAMAGLAAASRSLRGNVDRNLIPDAAGVSSVPVVPYVGTWIEISRYGIVGISNPVVPYVGTWIEISSPSNAYAHNASFPTWERG